MGELYDVIRKIAEDKGEYGAAVPEPDDFPEDDGSGEPAGEDDEAWLEEGGPEECGPEDRGPIRLAVVGPPHVGKSPLVNRLIGEVSLLTGPGPGITRAATQAQWP